jgi:hypothetical protein
MRKRNHLHDILTGCRLKPCPDLPQREELKVNKHTLTRQEAKGLIEGCEAEQDPAERLHALQDLWSGHRHAGSLFIVCAWLAGDPAEAAAELAHLLAEYVDECASPRDDRTPRGSAPTDLTAPAGTDWE